MNDSKFNIKDLYLSNEYLKKHPSLHKEDTPWKVDKIIPFIKKYLKYISKDEISILDIGGGAGLILKFVSWYMKKHFGIKVNKYAVELSPKILETQKKINPDLKKALNEDICGKTSIKEKEIDLTLFIDVLEHIPNPIDALKEVRRISKYAIIHSPLEKNLVLRIGNFISRGKIRNHLINTIGHINNFNLKDLQNQINKHLGSLLYFYYTNSFKYSLSVSNIETDKGLKKLISDIFYRLYYSIAYYTFKLSPTLCSIVFNDHIIVLIKCK